MPKETKRFINPLLRPSVEVETKREEVQPQPEQRVPAEKTSSDTSTNTSASTMKETPASPQTEEAVYIPQPAEAHPSSSSYSPAKQLVMQPSTETSTYQDEREQQRRPRRGGSSPAAHEAPVAPPHMETAEEIRFAASSTAPVYSEDTLPDVSNFSARGRSTPPSLSSSTASMTQTTPFPSTSHPEAWGPSVVPTPDSSLPETSFPSTSTYTSARQSISPVGEGSDELVEQEHYSPRPSSRRRRGALAFEKTHERITLWIDKRLKQGFEDLAYEQETSKTALLNEAISDLLRKYTPR